jgi:hypothetical protein
MFILDLRIKWLRIVDMAESDKKWTDLIGEEDLSFIKRFILASGSLKEMAEIYGVTYPTIRLRLDRVIQALKVIDDYDNRTPFEQLLRLQFAKGGLDAETFKRLLGAYRAERKGTQ